MTRGLSRAARGFTYAVSAEQVAAFRRLSPAERLRWLEEMRVFSFRLAPEKTRARWNELRGRSNAHPSDEPPATRGPLFSSKG
jgi:hypothetical protein